MPTLIRSTTFSDIYGNNFSKYTANAGDNITCRIDFSTSITILTSQTQQITYSQLTGEVKISEGSWFDEGFRVGDIIGFAEFNQNNNPTGSILLTILAMPTDKIIVVSGLPSANNATPPDKHIWQFWVNKQKEEIELLVNWIDNENTSTTPDFSSLIDGESQRFSLVNLNAMTVTNGAGGGTYFTQVGKQSGSFTINTVRMYRFNDDTYGTALRQNYSLFFTITDFGMLFPEMYIGANCLKLVSKLALKTKTGDTKTNDVYYLDKANTGLFNEAYNSDISKVSVFPTSPSSLAYNVATEIPFSVTVNTTSNNFEIGACYSTLDDTYNENQFGTQNKYLKLLKTGLIGTSQIGTNFFSEYFVNEFYSIKLDSLTITTSGANKTFSGVLIFNPYYSYSNGFGKFIESRGDSDRGMYIWIKVANTNCLIFGNQLTFEFPVGKELFPFNKQIINHDDNFNHDDMLTTGFTYADDINIEDDLGFFADVWLNTADVNSSLQIEVVCKTSTNEFNLEKMSFDLSNQDLANWVSITQNVTNNLPTSSAKKQAYLKKKGVHSLGIIVRLYYPFLVRWEYWLKQLNASSYYVANNTNNKNWLNYDNVPLGKLYLKIGVIRNGVMDYDYTPLNPKQYDYLTNIVSKIELFDDATGAPATSIIKGHIYTVKATHTKTIGSWATYPYGQITIEPKESAPRFMISTEIDADISPLNPLIGNSVKRLDEVRPNIQTVIYSCKFDATNISGTNYCFTSKISEQGTNNNPIFEYKITEDGIDKITEDAILKQIE